MAEPKPTPGSCRECGRPLLTRQKIWCSTRCAAEGRKGQPHPVTKRYTLAERFWAKVDKHTGFRAPHMDSDCWLWTAHLNNHGYGEIGIDDNREFAHRVSWALALDISIPPAETKILHKCDQPACVRPSHLYAGTMKDNTQDMLDRHRQRPKLSHCLKGHPLTPENTRISKLNGNRRCKTCERDYTRSWRQRHRSAS